MKQGAARLDRLHGLRSRVADAATAERSRLAREARAAQQELLDLESGMRLGSEQTCGGIEGWSRFHAELSVATALKAQWMVRRDQLREAEHDAAVLEREAVLAREQIHRVRERMAAEQSRLHDRREQLRLDDLFAIARVRATMMTP